MELKDVEFLEKNNICLLLTSTINAKDFSFVGRRGMKNRENDYLEAILFYSKFNFPIVFIDNSNYRSKQIESVISNLSESEYLTFESEESYRGKGHGELEILKFGLKSSVIIQKYRNIVKISGRYIISNFYQFYSKLNLSKSFHYCNYSRKFTWVDTRVMVLDKSFIINYLFPTMEKFLNESESIFFERAYARSIHLYQFEGGEISLWPVYPYFNGVNGENGKQISFSIIKKIKYNIYYKIKTYVFSQII